MIDVNNLDNFSLEDVLLSFGAVESDSEKFYTDLFKLDEEGYLQNEGQESYDLRANPLVYFKNNSAKTGNYRVLFKDTFFKHLKEAQEADFAILNGISYFGRRNTQAHASKMYAMIFDLDGVNSKGLYRFLYGTGLGGTGARIYPLPTYVILSGNNVHLYYCFEEPIPLFPNIKLQLKELKYAITDRIWNPYTSFVEKKQFQGINQGFRVVGGKTKRKGIRVRAFKLTEHPMNLTDLNEFVEADKQIDDKALFRDSKYTLKEAKNKFPEWYKRVVVDKKRGYENVKKWDIAGKVHGPDPYALYHWWLKKIYEGASPGHRYFCVMALAIYAIKNSVPFEKLKKDVYALIPYFNSLKIDDPFTEADVKSALECYDPAYCTFPSKDISKLTQIPIVKNKRNFLKQKDHLEIARAIQQIKDRQQKKNWRDGNGRKKGTCEKRDIVLKWRIENPGGKKIECHRDTGLSRVTINKWWTPIFDNEKYTSYSEIPFSIKRKYMKQMKRRYLNMDRTADEKKYFIERDFLYEMMKLLGFQNLELVETIMNKRVRSKNKT